jgi:coiled-coil domain-containing protein 12
MSSHEKLSAASNDRKARLAQLKSLKRKQAPDDTPTDDDATSTALTTTTEEPSITSTYLSGRNFDPTTRNVKLGFEATPIADPTSTLEYKAAQLALATKAAQEAEKTDAPLDLFRLQPKKPNWDLKRDLEEKMRQGGLERGLENSIARAVRERVEGQKKGRVERAQGQEGQGNKGDGEEVGMEGGELVEAMHLREAEEERERRRDEEEDAGVET